jgi:hypothetical protein
MIFQHPTTKVKTQVNRHNDITISYYRREGWIDITPPRTPAQEAATAKFLASGNLARILQNLRHVIRTERNNLDTKQMDTLNRTEIILQQLSKKYRSNKTTKK